MFIVEIKSFTWITLYDVVMQDVVYVMIFCNNWIMHCYFVNLNCMMLLNKMCSIDEDELGWDLGWLDWVVKWNLKRNIILSITRDLLV
jgi:hypothetical protein